jgi:hypothetical protein
MPLLRRVAVAILIAGCALAQQSPAPGAPASARWFRGNTHAHSLRSDGDSAPEVVARWYKDHGYHFVVLTDHDQRTPVEPLNKALALPGEFLVLAGEEVTDRFQGAPVHLNAIGLRDTVKPQSGESPAAVLQSNARAIRAAGGLPQINHPNFGWALRAEDIAAAAEAPLFELWNGHPLVNNAGGGGSPSTEQIWDAVLSTGRRIFGVATDDAHHFQGEFSRRQANPGRGWIVVRAAELTAEAIAAALERGDFYASTGVELLRCDVDDRGIRIALPENPSRNAPRYRTRFIGKHGAVLKQDESLNPAYEFRGDELYVRARVESSDGSHAWTQPVFPKRKP